jgi:aminoglycoside phosphotransferase (APT) family kinase protein
VSFIGPDGQRVEESCVLQEEADATVLESDEAPGRMTGSRRRPETEYAVMKALESTGYPVPHMLWIDTSGEWLERPFIVMRKSRGEADDAELFEDGREAQRERVFASYIELLGRLHALDPFEIGADLFGTSSTPETVAAEQVALFESGYRKQAMETHPAIEYVIRWCKKNLPVAAQVSLVHGDFRRGNFLFEDDGITAVLDWEQCHLGDPMEEIAFMYWPLWSLEPVIPLDDLLARYEEASGIEVNRDTLAFYRVFIELKMVVVILTGFKSFFATEQRKLEYAVISFPIATATMLRVIDSLLAGGPTYDYTAAVPATTAP